MRFSHETFPLRVPCIAELLTQPPYRKGERLPFALSDRPPLCR